MKHLVALSGGKDSTALALRLREVEPDLDFIYACTPTGDELPEMIGHWLKLEELLGTKLTYLSSGHSLGSLIEKWNALPNWRQRWCSTLNWRSDPRILNMLAKALEDARNREKNQERPQP